jgi:predicted amino acid-binding ACT domain protein
MAGRPSQAERQELKAIGDMLAEKLDAVIRVQQAVMEDMAALRAKVNILEERQGALQYRARILSDS